MTEFDLMQQLPRREVLKGAAVSLASLGSALAMEGVLAAAKPAPAAKPAAPAAKGPTLPCGVIGLGLQGRELVGILGRHPMTECVALCDTYEPYVKRTATDAPKAATYSDYRQLLASPAVKAVFVATPSHQHKQIVLDAIQAGKHVYCEAPLAVSMEEAKAIALAGKASKQAFAVGVQYRANPEHQHARKFMSALSHLAEVRGQWHKKTSWRRAAPNPQRAEQLNWRLNRATSSGLMGEIGMHQVDIASWFLNARPLSVTGFGGIMNSDWANDGRDVPDTVQCIVEYPKNLRLNYDATLVNSFGGSYEAFYGAYAALLTQDLRAWMMKEVDSPLLGWEVYAGKVKMAETSPDIGIVLIANATKILNAGGEPGKTALDTTKTPLYWAVEEFATAVKENRQPVNGAAVGYEATVVGNKCNEATLSNSKIVFEKTMFDL